jgi:hypothetical protein
MTPALSRFLLFHAIATCAAGVVLVVAPDLIPSTVGVSLAAQANLMAYLLAGSEFGFAALSYLARAVTDVRALRAILVSLVVLHLSTAAVEVLAFTQGAAPSILANVGFRVVVAGVFLYFVRQCGAVSKVGASGNGRGSDSAA